jgi:hypothetical protein
MAPKMMAKGLDWSMEAAPVLSGGLPPVVEAGLEAAAEVERVKVAEETVVFKPAEGLMEAEAAAEVMLATTDEAEAAALEAAAEAEDLMEATAEETALDPPVRGNWPE